jgi:hypothetical protein
MVPAFISIAGSSSGRMKGVYSISAVWTSSKYAVA